MEKSQLLQTIGDTMENRIIDFLVEGIGIDYTKKDIASGCKISRPTLYKICPRLLKTKILKPTRKVGNIQLYTLNVDNEKVRALLKLEEFLLNKSFEKVDKKVLIEA